MGGGTGDAGGKQHIKQPSFLCFIQLMFLLIHSLPSSVFNFLLEVTGTGDLMKHDTHMTCSNFKTISNTSAHHEYAHFNHHYSP